MTAITPSPLVTDLGDEAARDGSVCGNKAAVLARLTAEGLPVPEGVVLTVDVCRAIEGQGRSARVAAASAVVERLGDVRVAVRSSGAAEDLPGASFAGQYESIIGPSGVDEIAEAIERCIASGRSHRVAAYSAAKGTGADGGMAVLIQRLVDADAAGVAFTANPITGDRDEVTVSAVRGMGERLVSGEATPDQWTVRGEDLECLHAPEHAVDADAVRAIAELARDVERILGVPQDVEWAIADGELWLLQARPITALPEPPVFDVPEEGFWTKDDMHYPAPLTPFGASIYLPAVEFGMPAMIAEFGLPFDGTYQRSFGGEAYSRIIPPGGKDRPTPPWWVIAAVTRLSPAMRRREKVARRVLDSDVVDEVLATWPSLRAEFLAETAQLRAVDLAVLDDAALIAHLDAAIDLLRRGQVVHFRLFLPYIVASYELGTACAGLLGWSPIRAMSLVSGTSDATSEPGRALAALAGAVAVSPRASEIVRKGPGDGLQRLRADAPEVAAQIDDYLDKYGHRPVSYDPGDVTLAERPGLILGLLRDALDRAVPGDASATEHERDEALADARARLATARPGDRDRFEKALALATRAYPVREDNVFVVDGLPSGLIRRAALEIGQRLTRRGELAGAHDAVFLEDDELRLALARHEADWRNLVGRRKAERAWVLAHPGPPSYGRDPGRPDLRGLPRGLRYVTGAVTWMMDSAFTQATSDAGDDDHEIRGIAGSPGRYTGPVAIVREESQFEQLRPGDVLVCPTTTPAWSVLYTRAGALVTDGGGLLSHAAVIAREYGIPAVLATNGATRRLRNGDVVTVDGTTGRVAVTATT
jgi:phosphohistidine swiveling domain-containing protein